MHRLVLIVLLLHLPIAAAQVTVSPTGSGELPAAITGEGDALQGRPVHYFPADPATTGYLATPDGDGPWPAVILIHEWNGLVERVRQVADDFAAEGYVALAADMYSGRTGNNPEENRALVKETLADQDQLIANLDAAVTYLESHRKTSGRVATIGWCYGGGVALSFALGGKHHDGTAIFYGRLLDDPEKMKRIDHEIYGTFAGQDQMISREQVDRFVEALRAAGIKNDVHIYDHVNHGFWLHVDKDPEKRRAPALDAWQRLKAYLSRVLGK